MILCLLVEPPGSGKSSVAKEYENDGFVHISQDNQGREGHLELFLKTLKENKSICVDRMNCK